MISPDNMGATSVRSWSNGRRRETRAPFAAYYREFVQLERLKKNSQFGANRTLVFGEPNGVVAAMPCEAMSLSMMVRLG